MAVERAIQAHIEATKALMAVDNDVSLKSTPADSTQMEKSAPPPTTDAWVSAPWEYLKIPSRGKSRLGPMPRFIPLPNEDSTKKPQE